MRNLNRSYVVLRPVGLADSGRNILRPVVRRNILKWSYAYSNPIADLAEGGGSILKHNNSYIIHPIIFVLPPFQFDIL